MKKVFNTRHFSRWMRKTELSDSAICVAVAEMEQGLMPCPVNDRFRRKIQVFGKFGILPGPDAPRYFPLPI
jgi:hypothetical protein